MPTAAERTSAALSRLRRLYAGENQQVIYAEQIASAEKSHNERLAMGLEIRAYGGWDIKDTIEKAFESDESDLADAYRAEHPADESESLSGEWLVKSLPFRGRGGGVATGVLCCDIKTDGVYRGEMEVFWDTQAVRVKVFGVYLKELKTRGDVRNLCRELGISLENKA